MRSCERPRPAPGPAPTPSGPCTGPSLRRTGFTVAELLAIVIVLSVFAMTARQNLRPSNEYTLDLAAVQISEAVRFARSEAIRTGGAYGVIIDPAAARIRAYQAGTAAVPTSPAFDVRHPLSKQIYDVRLQDRHGTGSVAVVTSASHAAACLAPNDIIFVGTGTPHCGDPWASLLTTALIRVSFDGGQRTIMIDGETGRTVIN